MNYKVLYRKYRPTTFENVIGQDYIISTLKNSISNNMISHAYIFSGPRGTGKTSTAKIFSKAINCLNSKNGSPCNDCEFCTNFAENPDIIEIDAASNNGVDEIRELIDNIKLTPSNGKYKVYIIDEVHMLTTSAFNALLLTLEEPPAHAIFILATTNIENVPITILSRCQRFDFKKIAVEDIVKGLENVCKQENIDFELEALTEIAYLSEGGMRDALSLLDQLSKNKEKITLSMIESQIKTISQKGVTDLLTALEENDAEKLLNTLRDYEKRAVDYKTLIKKIIDIASIKAKNIKKSGKQVRLNFNDYKNIIINLSDCLSKINVNVNPYTLLEIILLENIDINVTINIEVSNSQKKDYNIKESSEKKNINTSFDESIVEKRINNCFVNAQKSYLEQLKAKFKKLDSKLSNNGKIRSILIDSQLVAASDKYIIFSCNNEHLAKSANNEIINIEKILRLEFDINYKVIFISESKWNNVKETYISNMKSNKKYIFIPDNDEANDDLEVSSVFDINKVEII